VRLDYDLVADLVAETLTLGESTVRFNQIPVMFAGTINYADEPRVDLRLSVPELEVGPTLAALPQGLVPPVAEFDPAGRISAWAELRGAVAQTEALLQQGEVRLNQVSVHLGESRAALDGLLRLGPGTVSSQNLVLHVGEERATVDLQVTNLFGEVIDVKSAVKAERFALDPLLQTAAAPVAAAEEPTREPYEPLDLPLRAQGTVSVGQTLYRGLTINDFLLTYRLEKNVLTVQQVTGKAIGGSFQGNARVDLGNPQPPFRAAIELQGLQADPLVSAFLPGAAGTVFGTLNLQTQLEGKGMEAEQIRRSLTGAGTVSIRDGQLTGDGLVRDLADFLKLEEMRDLRFSEAKGSFTAKDGNLLLDSAIEGRTVRLHPKGTIGLENFSLNLSLDPRFSPELTQKLDRRGTVTQFLKDDQGWGGVPIRVAGTAAEPRFTIDTTGVQKQLRERVDQELRQQLDRGLEKLLPRQEKQPPAEGETPAEQPKRSPLEDTIRGLFR
jgi:AsmA protein